MEKEMKSMTVEEFTKAARKKGLDDSWIENTIREAKLDADINLAQKEKRIAIPLNERLADIYYFIVKAWNPVEQYPIMPPVEDISA